MENKKYTKEECKNLLLSVKREGHDTKNGMEKLVEMLDKKGYFEAPGSTRFHGAYEGGLKDHCMSLYNLFNELCKKFDLIYEPFTKDSIIICALLHDLCKVGKYNINPDTGKISVNREHPKGHALLSINRIKSFINITPLEESIIKYHMGFYGTVETGFGYDTEYRLKDIITEWNGNKLGKLFYFCDDMSSQFLED